MAGSRGHLVAALCTLGVGVGIALGGQSPTPEAAAAREAVDALASERWPDRIEASSTLLELARSMEPAESLTVLESALLEWLAEGDAAEGDRAEVLARFELVAAEAFYNAPRAGLGITYDTTPTSRGVRLGDTVEGFDAHGTLRGGDIVLSLSGTPIEAGSMDLPVAIASHLPGETCVISLLRNGEPMEVSVRLGNRAQLNAARQLNDPVLRRAWTLRMNRLRGAEERIVLDGDAARSVTAAPPSVGAGRIRASAAEVALGGQPGGNTARRAGVVAQIEGRNGNQAAVRAELTRVNGDLARVVRRSIDIEETVRQLMLEVRMTADTADGRAHADRLRERITELRAELAPLQREQTRLMQERVQLIRALSQ
ncbi:MAG: hypothetical protein ACIAS6_12765 [Phycisphaerales bacterium JB060]